MTKQEFVAEVANRSQLTARDAGKAVDAVLETITDTLKSGGEVAFTGFGKFTAQNRAGAHGRQSAQPDGEGPHPCGARAEVLGRQPAQGCGQGRLSQRDDGHVSSEDRREAARAASRAFRVCPTLAVDFAAWRRISRSARRCR